MRRKEKKISKKNIKKISKKTSEKNILVTGSAGLIGSEAVRFFVNQGFTVYGIDNDMRRYFFGNEASTKWNRDRLKKDLKDKYIHLDIDIRDNKKLEELFQKTPFTLIIHTAAQPSHDWAAREPITDFSVNALGTLYLLENYRKYNPDGVFIFTSTNKVYGDSPNRLPVVELETRWELPKRHTYYAGIDDTMSIDNSLHSLFGAAKLSADIMVQEYGRYFHLKTVSIRGGCLTGPAHSGTQLHGFLAYLIRCIYRGDPYTIFGYKGKQVRDNIHSHDFVHALYHFYKHPTSGQAYNLGGSRYSNTSILEAIKKTEKILGKKAKTRYINISRKGDHIWYISDNTKFLRDYPDFKLNYSNDKIIEDICRFGHFD